MVQIPFPGSRRSVAVASREMYGLRVPAAVKRRSPILPRPSISSPCFVPLPRFHAEREVVLNTATEERTWRFEDKVERPKLPWTGPTFTFLPLLVAFDVDRRATTVLVELLSLLPAMPATGALPVVTLWPPLSFEQVQERLNELCSVYADKTTLHLANVVSDASGLFRLTSPVDTLSSRVISRLIAYVKLIPQQPVLTVSPTAGPRALTVAMELSPRILVA